jgi:hypothetical protein
MTVRDFRNYDFESWNVPAKYEGDYAPQNYFKGEFIPVARKEFKALAKKIGAELLFSPSYFEFSAFFKKDGKFIYVHVGDVRFQQNWYEDILYRTAKDEKDYTGGSNRYCSYDELETRLSELFERMVA